MMDGYITLFTDASLDPARKIGTWSCTVQGHDASGNLKKTNHRGVFKNPITCVATAELMAIANALVVARMSVHLSRKIIVINTDCQLAVSLFGGRDCHPIREDTKKEWSDMIDAVYKHVPHDSVLRLKKVKAHSNKEGGRSYMNNKVDKHCRELLRQVSPVNKPKKRRKKCKK